MRGAGVKRTALPVVLALTIVAAVLRFWGLTRSSIWVDETFTLVYAGVFEPMTPDKFFINLQGAGHALLLHGWSRLFGDGEFALRAFGALVGTAAVPLLYGAVRPLLGAGPALAAAGLIAVNPFHIWYSQEIRGYILMILAVIGAMGVWTARERDDAREFAPGSVARTPRRIPWLAGAGWNLVGLLSNLSYVFVGLAQGLWLVLRGGAGRKLWRPLLLGWAVSLICLSPWLVQFYQRSLAPSGAFGGPPAERLEEVRGSTASSFLGVPYAYLALATGFSYGPSLRELHEADRVGLRRIIERHLPALLWVALAFGSVAGLGSARLWRLGSPARAWLLLAVVPVLAAFVVAQLNIKMMNVRYAAAALPAVLVILAAGVTAPRRLVFRLALGGALLIPTGVSLANLQRNPAHQKDDARSVAAFLRQEAAPGDLLFIVGTEVPLRDYYWRLPGGRPPGLTVADAWPGYWAGTPFEEQTERFEALRLAHRRTWVLFLRPKDIDREGRWSAWFERRGGVRRDLQWPGARILELGEGGT